MIIIIIQDNKTIMPINKNIIKINYYYYQYNQLIFYNVVIKEKNRKQFCYDGTVSAILTFAMQ